MWFILLQLTQIIVEIWALYWKMPYFVYLNKGLTILNTKFTSSLSTDIRNILKTYKLFKEFFRHQLVVQ
jgi:hypothetical protein